MSSVDFTVIQKLVPQIMIDCNRTITMKRIPILILLLGGVLQGAAQIAFQREEGQMQITVDGNRFATYVWNDPVTTRPYFKHLHAPGGKVQLTRNHPPKPGDIGDHETYHPGLWWGFGDVGGNDYWRLKARSIGGDFIEKPKGGEDRGTFAVRNKLLVNRSDRVFCEQTCHYTILRRPEGILMICESTFLRDDSNYWLGDQEEMGLAFRVGFDVTMKRGGRLLNSAGKTDLKSIRTKQSDWCDYSGAANGKFAGMMLMADPGNFRRPWWHAVDNGLLVANPLGESELNGRGKRKQNVLVKKGEPFGLRFGVLMHINDRKEEFKPEDAYQSFLRLLPKKKAALPSVPDGFQVRVFAQEPLVYKPTSLAFDARGRLFVGQGPQYPKNEDGSPTDSVHLLIDSNGDGEADERKEFAKGFNSIQGLVWKGRDLYVANAPELTIVRDLNGDDEADEYIVVYTDLGNREHALHGLRFGPDGKLYMSKGNSKGHNQPEKYGYGAPKPFRELWDVEHPPGAPDSYPPKKYTRDNYIKTYHDWDDDWGREGGVLRCDPMGKNLEIVSRGMRNPWDIAFDDGFNWVGTDNDQTQGDKIIMPFYGAHFGWGHKYSSHWTGEGHLPTAPMSGPLFSGSGAGIVYHAHPSFPPAYRDVFFINDWMFGTYIYRPAWKGALRHGSLEPFMQRAADGILYRPTDIEFGADGSLFTLGWGGNYDYEPGMEGSWIFRVTYEDAKIRRAEVRTDFDRMNVNELIQELGPEALPARRVNAQDELVRRGPKVCRKLIEAIVEQPLSTGQQTWAAWALARLQDERMSGVFRSWADSENRFPLNLRIQAIRILATQKSIDLSKSPLFSKFLTDPDPRIRFEGVQHLHQTWKRYPIDPLIDLLATERDRITYYAAWQALRKLASTDQRKALLKHPNPRVRLAALLGLQTEFQLTQKETFDLVDNDDDPDLQSWALTYAMNPRPPKKMPNSKSRIEFEQTVPIADLIRRANSAKSKPHVYQLYLQLIGRASLRGRGQQDQLLKFYRGLESGRERKDVLPALASNPSALPELWDALESTVTRMSAIAALREQVQLQTAGLRSTEEAIRGAAKQFGSVGESAAFVANRLLDQISDTDPQDKRIDGALRAMESFPLPKQWQLQSSHLNVVLDILNVREEPNVVLSVLRLITQSDPNPLKRDQRVQNSFRRLARETNARLHRDLTIAASHLDLDMSIPAPQAATAAGIRSSLTNADISRGREFFFDPVRGAGCAVCHRVRGEGNPVAPDLTGIATRLNTDGLIDAILSPSANITEGYSQHQIDLNDGESMTGAIVRESSASVTLLAVDGSQISIEKTRIRKRQKLKLSAMPAGYGLFGNTQLADLTAWLLTLQDGAAQVQR